MRWDKYNPDDRFPFGHYAVVNVDNETEIGNVYTVHLDPSESNLTAVCQESFGWSPTHCLHLEPVPYNRDYDKP